MIILVICLGFSLPGAGGPVLAGFLTLLLPDLESRLDANTGLRISRRFYVVWPWVGLRFVESNAIRDESVAS